MDTMKKTVKCSTFRLHNERDKRHPLLCISNSKSFSSPNKCSL